MSEELKACPLCASKAEPFYDEYKKKTHTVCSNIDCPLYVDAGITPDEWNTRPLEDALQQKHDDAVNFIISDEETYRKIMENTLNRAVEIEEKRIEQQKLDDAVNYAIEEERIENMTQKTDFYFDTEAE